MNGEPLRVVQITDSHLLAEHGARVHGVDTFAALERIVERIRSAAWRPQVVIATGDLSEDGSSGSYRRLRGLLLQLEVPVVCIPGNHDGREAMQAHLAGGSIQLQRVVALATWRIVLLDSCVTGKSHGRLGPAELDALRQALDAGGGQHALVALHHGPVSPCPMPECRLENADELLELMRAHPSARGVISGHLHCAIDEDRGGVRAIVTPSTCAFATHPTSADEVRPFLQSHQLDPARRGFRRLELHRDGAIVTEVIWDHELEDENPRLG